MCCVVLGHIRLGCVGFFKDRLLWCFLSFVMLGWISCFVLCCLRLGYVGLFEVKVGRVALCCFKVGLVGLFQNEARAS